MANEEMMNDAAQVSAGGGGSLTREERDTIGEMTNIAMGAAISTLSVLLGHEIDLSVPEVAEYGSIIDFDEPMSGDEKLFIFVKYTSGFSASSGYLMKVIDARRIAAQMLGNDDPGTGPLGELELSAITEVMSQMMNSAATSMASVIHRAVEVSNPIVVPYSGEALHEHLPKLADEAFAKVEFDMNFADGSKVRFAQVVVASEARDQIGQLLAVEPERQQAQAQGDYDVDELAAAHAALEQEFGPEPVRQPTMSTTSSGGGRGPSPVQQQLDPVTVRPVEFASFDNQPAVYGEEHKNLDLVMDVTLNLTVELGRTEISIKDVLELTRGSVIELDRVAGEPVDLLANGKLIAKGEVVVIEDNFGLRITSIVSPADRLRGL